MNEHLGSSAHPVVVEYLREFDAVARDIPSPRRRVLREELESHLRELVPLDATNAEAAETVADFGSPVEIVEQESGKAPARRSSGWPGVVRLALILVLGCAVVAVAVFFVFFVPVGTAETDGGASVSVDPQGPQRVTDGTAYYEYMAAIESIEHPLPLGVEYPAGVPQGLESGPTRDGGVMQSGAGTVVAHFTWLCAWEQEYLLAFEAEDAQRRVAAESMIASWPKHDIVDGVEGWVSRVVAPMEFGDPTGVKTDMPQTCAQAGIFGTPA